MLLCQAFFNIYCRCKAAPSLAGASFWFTQHFCTRRWPHVTQLGRHVHFLTGPAAVCVCGRVHVCVYMCVHPYTWVCVHVYVSVCVCACVCIMYPHPIAIILCHFSHNQCLNLTFTEEHFFCPSLPVTWWCKQHLALHTICIPTKFHGFLSYGLLLQFSAPLAV